MNTGKVIHQAKLNYWIETIRAQQSSNQNITQWCESNHISKTQFYYWKRQLKEMYLESQLPEIVPITLPSSELSSTSCKTCTTPMHSPDSFAIARITIGDISIEVDPTLPTELLCSLIKAVRYA